MSIRANIDKRYVMKVWFAAGMFMVFSGWFLWDGFVSYPWEHQVAVEYDEYKSKGIIDQWPAYATSKSWPDGSQGEPGSRHDGWDIPIQKFIGFAILPVGLFFVTGALRMRSRWVESNETGLSTSWGQRAAFADMTNLNKDRWRTKGIAVLTYKDGGRDRRLVLDDWKYQRKETTDLLELLEKHLKPEQVTGDKPHQLPATNIVPESGTGEDQSDKS